MWWEVHFRGTNERRKKKAAVLNPADKSNLSEYCCQATHTCDRRTVNLNINALTAQLPCRCINESWGWLLLWPQHLILSTDNVSVWKLSTFWCLSLSVQHTWLQCTCCSHLRTVQCFQFSLDRLCSIRGMIWICIEQDSEWVCPKGNVMAPFKNNISFEITARINPAVNLFLNLFLIQLVLICRSHFRSPWFRPAHSCQKKNWELKHAVLWLHQEIGSKIVIDAVSGKLNHKVWT